MTNRLATNFGEFSNPTDFFASAVSGASFDSSLYSSFFGYTTGNGRVFVQNHFSGGSSTFPLSPTGDEFYFHFAWGPSDFTTGIPGVWVLLESGTTHGGLAFDPTTHTFYVWRGSTANVLFTTRAIPDGPHTFCFRYKVHSTTGAAQLWVDGALEGTFTGNTRNGGTSGIMTTVQFLSVGTSISGPLGYYTDFFINDPNGSVNNGFDGAIRVAEDVPNANGASGVAMTPSAGTNYQNVDDPIRALHDADSTYNETSTYPAIDWFAFPSFGITGTPRYAGVVYYAKTTDAGAHTARGKCKSGGVVADGATLSVQSAYTRKQDGFPLDPATSAVWTSLADIASAEFGVEAVS